MPGSPTGALEKPRLPTPASIPKLRQRSGNPRQQDEAYTALSAPRSPPGLLL
jgi:hypothetical protein